MALRNRRSYRALTLKQFKGVDNAWLAPDGKLYPSGHMGHNEWASDYIFDKLAKKNHDKFMKLAYDENRYPYQCLHNLGWFRILSWTSDTKLLCEVRNPKLTHEQKETLQFWCHFNGENYDEFTRKINE